MAITAEFRDALARCVDAGRILSEAADTWVYGYDNSRKHSPPDLVVLAENAHEARAVIRLCYEHNVPIVARGRGTATTGAAIPTRGGVVLALERMNRILRMDPANRAMVVEAGVTNQEVQDAAAKHGFFWPPDPTSAAYCSVGGNLAVNAAGPRAVKYGSTRENTLGLRAILGNGEEIHTGTYTTKGAVGYDLTRLLIGSEGTLAVILEATLKLTPLPETRRLMQAVYASVTDAAAAISRIMAQPATPCALEFMDAAAIEMIRDFSQAALPQDAGALLLIEVDGPASALDGMVAAIQTAATGNGLVEFRAAETKSDAEAIWTTRKALSPALRSIAPNKLNEDVVVPVSRLPELIDGLGALSRRYGIPIVNFGHAGNGNIHVNLMYDSQNPQQAASALPCVRAVFDLVLTLGGTLSGEHGIGCAKREYIALAIDPVTLDLMKRIKAQFDPKGILNPDKIFPD
ncbi:MAG: FAD-binding protein [Gammaproteobacteria bacterium]|nr:FAD-binding protein [Gammaproteobacteria bacterium]